MGTEWKLLDIEGKRDLDIGKLGTGLAVMGGGTLQAYDGGTLRDLTKADCGKFPLKGMWAFIQDSKGPVVLVSEHDDAFDLTEGWAHFSVYARTSEYKKKGYGPV